MPDRLDIVVHPPSGLATDHPHRREHAGKGAYHHQPILDDLHPGWLDASGWGVDRHRIDTASPPGTRGPVGPSRPERDGEARRVGILSLEPQRFVKRLRLVVVRVGSYGHVAA